MTKTATPTPDRKDKATTAMVRTTASVARGSRRRSRVTAAAAANNATQPPVSLSPPGIWGATMNSETTNTSTTVTTFMASN